MLARFEPKLLVRQSGQSISQTSRSLAQDPTTQSPKPHWSVSPGALSQGAARPDNRAWSARRKLYPEASQRVVSNDPNDLHGC